MEIVGPVPIKVNGRYAITVTNFNVKKAQNTKEFERPLETARPVALDGRADDLYHAGKN